MRAVSVYTALLFIIIFMTKAMAVEAKPIEAIQGLWIEADRCGCRVRSLDRSALQDVAVRCYHYISDSEVVSGYIRLGESRSRNRTLAKMAQQCSIELDQLSDNLKQSLRQVENRLSRYFHQSYGLGVLRSDLPDGIGSITYARGTLAYSQHSRDASMLEVSIWDDDPHHRGGDIYNDGVAINFIYSFMVGMLIGRQDGICSAYRLFSPQELYIGMHGDGRHYKKDCEQRRYRVLERYVQL